MKDEGELNGDGYNYDESRLLFGIYWWLRGMMVDSLNYLPGPKAIMYDGDVWD